MKELVAKDFMRKYVLTVTPDTSVADLLWIFLQHRVDAIPVVGDDYVLLGIVSEGDMLYKKVKPRIPGYVDVLGGNVYYFGFGRYEKSVRKVLALTAGDIMTKDVRCVTPDTDMETITTLMVDEHLKSVPVVERSKHIGEDGQPAARLVGIISRHDILGAIAGSQAEDIIRARRNQEIQ